MEGGEGGSEYVMLLYVPLGPPHSSETHEHKITIVPIFYMVLGLNDFDAGKSSTRAIGRSEPWNPDFFGPTLPKGYLFIYFIMSLVNGYYPPPLPHQNRDVPRHINNRYINC
jgi:hypothetical protein